MKTSLIAASLLVSGLVGNAYADSSHVCQGNSCNDSSVTNNAGGLGYGLGYSSVTNTNANAQAQSQRQRQSQGQNQGQYQDVNNRQVISPSQSTSFSEPVQDRFAPPIAAPALTAAGTGVCLGSVSFGLSGPMAGVSAGWTKVDEGCETRSNAALLFNMGMKDAALRLMMTNPIVREAVMGKVEASITSTPVVQTAEKVQGQ